AFRTSVRAKSFSGIGDDTALGQGTGHGRPFDPGALGGLRLAHDEHVDGHSEGRERSTQSRRFAGPVLDLTLDDQEVEVAVASGAATGV
nr:hypothetical protein [Solirubrobacteraceae bacterium]